MATYRFHQSHTGYETADVEAENEELAREMVNNGDCDWERGDSDNYEIYEVECLDQEPRPSFNPIIYEEPADNAEIARRQEEANRQAKGENETPDIIIK